jgi:hypothetical protein
MCQTYFTKPKNVPHRYVWCPNCSFITMVRCPTRPGACGQPCTYCIKQNIAPNPHAAVCNGVAPAFAGKQGACTVCAHPCAVSLTPDDKPGVAVVFPNGWGFHQHQQSQPKKGAASKKKKAAPVKEKPKKRKRTESSEEEDFGETSEDEAVSLGSEEEEDEDAEIQKLIDDADICLNCMESGFLIICEACGKGFHLECLS